MIRRTFIGAIALCAISLATPAFAANHEIEIKSFKFSTSVLEIAVGDTVTFTNADGAPHTATANNGAFDTGRMSKGESVMVTISEAGTFDYFCGVHPSMKAKIIAK